MPQFSHAADACVFHYDNPFDLTDKLTFPYSAKLFAPVAVKELFRQFAVVFVTADEQVCFRDENGQLNMFKNLENGGQQKLDIMREGIGYDELRFSDGAFAVGDEQFEGIVRVILLPVDNFIL
jgi:hypothetical protein